ncbi:MAG: terminase small subunit [Candidatus Hydrogenedentes bacterium]|nr:terminase small subunit [Candidatus Hydrogenedentota bacterium]
MAKKRAKVKKKVCKKTPGKSKRKGAKKTPRSKQPGKRNAYAHIPKYVLEGMDHPPRHTNGFDITDKQSLFVEYYLGAANLNATKAAIMAGYAKKSAQSQASTLMVNPHVTKYMRKRMDDRKRRMEVSQEKIIRELSVLAFSTPGEFAEWKGNSLFVKSSDEIPKYLQGAIKSIEPVSSKTGWRLKITFYDKVAATKLLMQHLGMLEVRASMASKGTIIEAMELIHAEAVKLGKGEK